MQTQPADFVLIDREGPIAILTLNDPDARNALSGPAQWNALVEACAALQRDASVKVVILTGAGSAFCAGGNVKDFRDRRGLAEGDGMQIRENYRNGIQRLTMGLFNLEVPVIAAVNGHAIGAGLDLACMCDLRIASEKAKFAESFVKLGIVPGDGGAWLLPRIVGMPKASLMALTGDTIDAAKALEWGLVTEVVPANAKVTAMPPVVYPLAVACSLVTPA